MDDKTKRIIDANINRISEGLRVTEDIFRYSIENASMQQSLKTLRHDFMSCLDRYIYIGSRASLEDIGYSSHGKKESERGSLKDIVAANVKRAEEGLRVLEEVCKLYSETDSMKMKRIRYLLYELEKKAIGLFYRKILGKGLYLIMEDLSQGYENLAEVAVKAEIPAIQMSWMNEPDKEFIRAALNVRRITAGTGTLFIIGNRPDIAELCNADGVQLGRDGMEPEMARSLLGEDFLLGVSADSIDQIALAQEMPVDYIMFDPSGKKLKKKSSDMDSLKKAAGSSKHPVVAVGYINRNDMKRLPDTGINNFAVKSSIKDAADPHKEICFLNNFWRRS